MFQPKTILNVLQNAPFEFVIIGGIAANVHGSTRATLDFDICMEFSGENVLLLSNLLRPYHPVHRISQDRPSFDISADNATGWKNLYLSTDIGVIDVLSEVIGIGHFQDVLKYSAITDFGGFACRVLGIEGLLLTKEALGREKDKEVIYQLKRIQEARSSH